MLTRNKTLIGEMLVEAGLVTQAQVEQALAEQRRQAHPLRLGEILVELRFLSETDLLPVLARQMGLDTIDLASEPPDSEALRLVPSEFALRHQLVPCRQTDHTLTVAMARPQDLQSQDDLRLLTGCEIQPLLAGPSDVRRAIEQLYMTQMLQDARDQELAVGVSDDESLDVADLQKMAREELVIQMVNLILNQAIQDRASDIHIEPFERELRVRYRVDGVLHEQSAPPRQYHAAIISRVKILSDMNIAERRLPQDGRMRIRQGGRQIDLRVSTVPTLYGESAVLRILDKQTAMLGLTELGMHGDMFAQFRRLILEPHGIILVTGPTGSGKTTTLYAALNEIYSVEKKIITIEDPVEYQLNGVNQIQVHPQIDLTFANGLRHIVRQDPDVIMVGEIRDAETVEIAIHAALTGHLVFSTLHTNDAAGAISRLLDMGAEPYLVASSLIGSIAQRLVRTNCPRCRRPIDVDTTEMSELGIDAEDLASATVMEGAGCPECRGVGLRGRSGLFEMITVDDEVRQMIVKREPSTLIKQYGTHHQGMVTLLQDGRRRVLKGDTTAKEVLRVCQREGFDV